MVPDRTMPPALEIHGIRKAFPSVVANDDVSFAVAPHSIHALLGENGAGKSTLVKMIYGVMRPDGGSMRLNGKPFAPTSPSAARAAGIGMVFQHFTLFEALTVTENIALGHQGSSAQLREQIGAVANAYGLAVDPSRLVGTLSVGERQRVEIIRCLLQNPRLLIMDEPTSVLTPQEAERLFQTLHRVRDGGCSILYISHKLDEVRGLCDAATVLRGGKVVGSCDPRRETAKSLAEMMLGGTLARINRPARAASSAPVRLAAQSLSLPRSHPFGTALDKVSFTVRAGEILGIAGVAGNGQVELMEALIGERPLADANMLLADGKPIGRFGPAQRRAAGLAFVPEERLGHSAVPSLSLVDNVLLSARAHEGLVQNGLIYGQRARDFAARVIDHFGVKAGGVLATARSLSGGNLQKFVVGREVLQQPAILIVSQPTWGVDAGAAAAIHQSHLDLAAQGTAVIVISQDLDELLALADRIAVIANGRLSEALPTAEVSLESIGRLMGGTGLGMTPIPALEAVP